jgi:hypothetical protein
MALALMVIPWRECMASDGREVSETGEGGRRNGGKVRWGSLLNAAVEVVPTLSWDKNRWVGARIHWLGGHGFFQPSTDIIFLYSEEARMITA